MMKRSTILMAAVAVVGLVSTANAAVTLKSGGDASGSSSYTTGNAWSDGLAPSSGKDYQVAVQWLRTPSDSIDHAFAGRSLEITTGGGFLAKGGGSTCTLTQNLILSGGTIRSGQGWGQIDHLAGTIAVNGTGSQIWSDQCDWYIDAPLSGTGALKLSCTNNAPGGAKYNIYVTGANTYTGNLTAVTAANTNELISFTSTSSYKFAIGANNTTNKIDTTGSLSAIHFGGEFNVDVTSAGQTLGDTWQLVTGGHAAYDPTFTVKGFTNSGTGLWTDTVGSTTYQFDQGTGTLSVTAVPEPAMIGVLGVGSLLALRRRRA